MLDFLKKNFKLTAPVSGEVMELSCVPDGIFAAKMAGDGIAINSTGDIVVAPADGEISLIFKTNHAFCMTLDNGMELLIHIGIDTVALCGEGFERLVNEGARVKAGDPIIKIDRNSELLRKYSLITPIIITNMDSFKINEVNVGQKVQAGKDIIFSYKCK
jgi:glucose-specific phosphotransferase system IIA component